MQRRAGATRAAGQVVRAVYDQGFKDETEKREKELREHPERHPMAKARRRAQMRRLGRKRRPGAKKFNDIQLRDAWRGTARAPAFNRVSMTRTALERTTRRSITRTAVVKRLDKIGLRKK